MAVVVKRKKGSNNDEMIGKFRRICMEEEITDEVKKRTAYEKPSAKRYAKKKVIIGLKKLRRRRARRAARR